MSEGKKRRSVSFRPFGFITGKIRNKLLAILLGIGFGTLIVAAVGLVAMKATQKTLEEAVEKESEIVAIVNEGHNLIFSARDFGQKYMINVIQLGFENARVEYVERVYDYLEETHEKMQCILEIEGDNEEVVGQLQDIHIAMQSFRVAFTEIVELKETKGHRNVGLVGELLQNIHDIESLIAGYPELEVLKLTLRNLEKDYLLKGDRKYYTAANHETIEEFMQAVLHSSLPAASKEQVKESLEAYQTSFAKIVYIDRSIAQRQRVLRSSTNLLSSVMEILVATRTAHQEEGIASLKELQQTALLVLIAVSAITLLVGFVAALIFSKRLTKQIDNIMAMFGNIGIGDFESRAEIVSKDELGEMAESLNAMLDNTLTLIQSREERDSIQNSIMRLLMEISDLADGDLTVRAEVTEEVTGAIADSFNSMAEQLSQVVKDVKEASAQVGSSSQDVEMVTTRLSEHSEEQAAKIQEAIKTIEDMARRMREVSSIASQSAEVSGMARSCAQEGSEAVKKTNEAMASIKENMRGTARTIKRLGESSQEIGNIVQIINDIADRTSILALNASIQAAEAGDAGRGFAVVAEEVQRLSERSAESTKQIKTLISTIQGEIGEAGTSMEKSIQYVVDGTDLADQAYSKLEEIEDVSNKLAEIIETISTNAQQQSVETESATAMMQEVGVLTEQTTNATRETTASMDKITCTSKQLEESISVFKIEKEALSAA